jgi:hypothetical protein
MIQFKCKPFTNLYFLVCEVVQWKRNAGSGISCYHVIAILCYFGALKFYFCLIVVFV